MGEENNLEKRLIFSGLVSASINPKPIHVEQPMIRKQPKILLHGVNFIKKEKL